MPNIDEQKSILEELNKIYKQNEDFLSNDRISTYLEKDMIQKVSIQRKKDPVYLNFTTYFPIIKIKGNAEIIVLFPSETIRRNKPLRQAFFDAACICKNVNRLIELRK
ncbi:hypothetical protein JZO86_09285 [Enterococcus ureasiticus]|uniref:hypothetical protein n=1 Tax=Enterococcus TaxID=1350 RepID=UPI001A8EA9D9|nr:MULTISPECIES: hypothetical protein [Enterococcus]MBO0433151.1 hypothetical protein [Enterococcus sp. DIV0849a]MBO0473892.1 hypothetical protein [Enterococcus ureasiticus]